MVLLLLLLLLLLLSAIYSTRGAASFKAPQH